MSDFEREAWTRRAGELLAREQREKAQANRRRASAVRRSFERKVVELAQREGWLVHVTSRAHGESGSGFPRLVLVRPPAVLFVELKAPSGKDGPVERGWLADLAACGQVVRLWRPGKWAEIQRVLSGGGS